MRRGGEKSREELAGDLAAKERRILELEALLKRDSGHGERDREGFHRTGGQQCIQLSDALNSINTVIHSTLDFDIIMQQAIREAARALEVEAAAIGLFIDEQFIVRYVYNMPGDVADAPVPASDMKGIHYTAAVRDVVAFNDAFNDDRLNLDRIRSLGIRSMMIAPIIVRGEILGAMSFQYVSAPHPFSDMHIDFARKLAASLSLALENARLYEHRKDMEELMRHMAHHDALTGLSNRRLFMQIAHIELAQARRNNRKTGILFLDLDRFKEVNDTLGHEAGDELLRGVAERLKSAMRESDTIARIGGDEFNILLADIHHAEDIAIFSRKLMDCFRTPFRIAGHDLHVSPSVGISIFPDDSENTEALLKYADIALYYAKEHGRNNYQFYNHAINLQSIERMKLEGRLRQTLERGELAVFYQPMVNIKSRQMLCAEALVRWKHPERGLLEPEQFIWAAEETGFITAIDEYVMRTACKQFRSWQEAGLSPVCFTVNLSAREFQNPDLAAKIANILEETGASPQCLDIEITETLAMSNVERTVTRLNELAAMGVHTSIDDFGTGYSSLNYLKRLPIEKLKIDQSFIKDIATDPDDRAIIGAVTAMAHHMRMKVIAEGVETEAQLSFLRDTHCDEAQGFLFSRALPAEEFKEFIREAGSSAFLFSAKGQT